MINFNGELTSESVLKTSNRAFLYGDGVFETVRISDGRILFLEDHYFRLMAAMRILRMEIPMHFTMEYFESEILVLAGNQGVSKSARARITVFRNDGGFYLPTERNVSFVISVSALDNQVYEVASGDYEIELYKDFYLSAQLLSTLKTTNKLVHITGSIFADENGYDNCLLMNESKNIVEALQGNIFMLTGNKLVTPPISEGCLNGIMRKQVLSIAKKIDGIEVLEVPISPFDLQKADELFITNVIKGIQPITKYRKKEYATAFSNSLVGKINELVVS
ncbi:MAG: aminotransferase class IV [Flavobacterium sp.]|nr:MAG: aminotransferase class IV [Flavobacterium sp.]